MTKTQPFVPKLNIVASEPSSKQNTERKEEPVEVEQPTPTPTLIKKASLNPESVAFVPKIIAP